MRDQIAIMNRARLQKRRNRDISVRNEAIELFKKYGNEPLFFSGIALYWAEGTRLTNNYRKYQLALTNSDSGLIRFYCEFLRKYFANIPKENWRAGLYLYPDINSKEAISYWSHILDIRQEQLIKPQILPSKNGQYKKLKFGTCCIYINSKDACITMQAWIELLCNSTRR